ncbi:hypothetical protein [Ruegeria atlantica]|uniref:hypothetical protein n=1 Tax=Ruegeria atlantica TaxID=81569 RepID=UPI00147CA34B|nr:hypothetical protein [Ruegeria atlantica]
MVDEYQEAVSRAIQLLEDEGVCLELDVSTHFGLQAARAEFQIALKESGCEVNFLVSGFQSGDPHGYIYYIYNTDICVGLAAEGKAKERLKSVFLAT